MTISEIIAWKFNSQPGMRCKEIDGVVQIVEFPGSNYTNQQIKTIIKSKL